MVKPSIIDQITADFKFLLSNPSFLGMILYGSWVHEMNSARSDIDLCIVESSNNPIKLYKEICVRVDIYGKNYDIQFFSEIPWYLRGKVIEEGITVLTPDMPQLFEYLHLYRKIWNDQKARQQMSKEDLLQIIKNCSQ
ncbi:MAG: nucleotidyltransferase domain-containing protein [Candidatus Lokiarchaeota archaeon]|nr:nucleotidyltransferase domain-containing protein [Candidatus Harpocratesius repetitus]